MEMLGPRSEEELAELIKAALANETPLKIEGGGSRNGLGRPLRVEQGLSTRNLSGVSMYEPSELVFTALPGTPMSEIEAMLADNRQEMAFEPMQHAALHGASIKTATVGGMIAVNASGPRRIRVGAARDHLLGFRAVTGRGEIIKSGGRVMKNVTGYDLSKLMAGAYGTLAVMSEVTVKVMPIAEMEQTLLILGLSDDMAVEVMTTASGLPLEVSSFAHLPQSIAPSFASDLPTGTNVTALRLEGPEISVTQRRDALQQQFKAEADGFEVLATAPSCSLWRAIRDAAAFNTGEQPLWRLSTAPASGAKLVEAIKQSGVPVLEHAYDWAGGLIWLTVEQAPDAHAAAIRVAVEQAGGHATLLRASEEVRMQTPVFHPQPTALAALSRRVKENFDPKLILNPGRMREGM